MNDQDLMQGLILVLTAASALASTDPRYRAEGYTLGLAAQPFWMLASYDAGLWGVFLVALAYTAAFARGLYLIATGGDR